MLTKEEITNKLFCGDCSEILSSIPDSSIDLIITSPPYNLGNNHHTGNYKHKTYNDNLPEEEYQMWQIKILKECYRVLNLSGSLFYNHKNRIKRRILF